jgi:prepilin-type N-terminal cleavage/methylation domain-containing protein
MKNSKGFTLLEIIFVVILLALTVTALCFGGVKGKGLDINQFEKMMQDPCSRPGAAFMLSNAELIECQKVDAIRKNGRNY